MSLLMFMDISRLRSPFHFIVGIDHGTDAGQFGVSKIIRFGALHLGFQENLLRGGTTYSINIR